MTNSLVIVAIPKEDDYVYKISSEKVPHLTLLFLGDDVTKVNNLAQIFDFVGHAASHLTCFGLEVDHRGTLGPEEADVLFFSKAKWSGIENVAQYRSFLLKDPNIKTAYDSATQFPEWQPHLTLGYPATPAHEDTRDYPGTSYVQFDKIAVWVKDSEGIEYPLQKHDWGAMEVAYSSIGQEAVEDILEHHGIKGMHWGVRKEVHPDIAHIPKKIRNDAEKDAEEFTRAKLFYGESAGTRRKLIKAKVEQKKKNSKHYTEAFDHFVEKTDLGKRADQAKSERKRKNAKNFSKKTAKGVGHVIRGNNQYANTAAVLGVGAGSILLKKHLAQGAMFVEDVIEHHGIKGMKWGVRRSARERADHFTKARARAKAPEVTIRETGKKIKTSGGKGHLAHPDAIRARTVGQIAKKSGPKALSNAELKIFNERLNLEQNFKRLNFEDKSRGAKFVDKALGRGVGKGVEQGTKSALNSSFVKKRAVRGAAAIAAVI